MRSFWLVEEFLYSDWHIRGFGLNSLEEATREARSMRNNDLARNEKPGRYRMVRVEQKEVVGLDEMDTFDRLKK